MDGFICAEWQIFIHSLFEMGISELNYRYNNTFTKYF